MVRARPAIEKLERYRPPLEGRGGKLRLDFNENTVGCAPAVVRFLQRAVTADWLSRYPEYEEGRVRLARHFGVAPEEMLVSNGVDDALKLLCDTFVDPGDVLLSPAPTFPMYHFFQTVAGGEIEFVRYDENLRLPIERVLRALRRRPRWVALANPNNPTGTLIPKNDLKRVLEAAPRTLVLVDEAYYDYSGETVLGWIRRYPNLVVARTFSKAFGLAGLRIGFVFANPKLIELMRRAQPVFAVNAMAVACAVEAIRHESYVRRYARAVRAQRAQLCRRLDSLGVAYAPSAANFVLVRIGPRAPEVAERLRRENILVRDWSYDPHLRGYLRITVGTRAQTRRLLHELGLLQHLMEKRDGPGAWRDLMTYSPTGYFA
jgi:histidinol-phosphate aminotransferase